MNVITYEHRRQIYDNALCTFGVHEQEDKFFEELGEFLESYEKFKHGRDTKEHFAEELADFTIMLEQLRIMCGVNDEVCSAMDAKVLRLQDRVNKYRERQLALQLDFAVSSANRDCAHCKNRVDGECQKWECSFERAGNGTR